MADQQPQPALLRPETHQRCDATAAGCGLNRVVPNVWSRSTTFNRSRFAPVEPPLQKAGVSLHPICTLAAEGRRRGIKVMPWFEYGLMEPADSSIVRNNPSWVLAKANGQRWMAMHGNHRMAWLNPAHPEVRALSLIHISEPTRPY